jgi:hypothetical protein
MDDCCRGHPCDHCPTCERGRCCRNDNPAYTLPREGDWPGPIHGQLGVLRDDGSQAQCHVCGDYYGHLGGHAARAHDLTPREYKAIFGLSNRTGLIGPDLAQKRSLQAHRLVQEGVLRTPDVPYLSTLTPEQVAALAASPRRRQYLEPRRAAKAERQRQHAEEVAAHAADPEFQRLKREKISVAQTAAQRRKGHAPTPTTSVCVMCGTVIPVVNRNVRAVCSDACWTARRRQVMTRNQTAKRPDVRAKIAAAAQARVLVRDAKGRIVTWSHADSSGP